MDLLTNPSNRNTDTIARGGQGSGTGMPLTSPRRSYEKESTENGLTNLDNLHGPTLGPGSAGASQWTCWSQRASHQPAAAAAGGLL